MPKVINNLRKEIILQSEKILFEKGYQHFTMREAANRCGIAVGTLYNYFSSKDELIGYILFNDWQIILTSMRKKCENAKNIEEALESLYQGIMNFSEKYRAIWDNYGSSIGLNSHYISRHEKLVDQLASIMEPVLNKEVRKFPDQMNLFLAENILLCAGKSRVTFTSLQEIIKAF